MKKRRQQHEQLDRPATLAAVFRPHGDDPSPHEQRVHPFIEQGEPQHDCGSTPLAEQAQFPAGFNFVKLAALA